MNPKSPEYYLKKLGETYSLEDWWPATSEFEIMVGAILTQNTSWENVETAISSLKGSIDLDARNILAISDGFLETLIYPSGYYKVKTRRLKALCDMLVKDFDGSEGIMKKLPWPQIRSKLLDVNGIGPETADAILLYALHKPVFVIDKYTKRIFSRLGFAPSTDSYEGWQQFFMQSLLNSTSLFKTYHALIVTHAKDLCRKQPICEPCPLKEDCQYSKKHDGIKEN